MPATPFKVWKFTEQRTSTPTVTILGPDGVVDAFDDFVVMESLSGSKTYNTLLSYAYDLKHWFSWLHNCNLQWDKVRYGVLPDFIHWLRFGEQLQVEQRVINVALKRIRKEKSIKRCIGSLYGFYDHHNASVFTRSLRDWQEVQYAKNRDKFNRTAFSNIERPYKLNDEDEGPVEFLREPQLDTLLNACDTVRDRFLIALLGKCGMRVGQALGLRLSDIDSRHGTYTIVPRADNVNGAYAKTDRVWRLPLPDELVELYDELIFERGDHDCDYVFLNLKGETAGEPMTYNGVRSLRKKLIRRTNVYFRIHMLRHTFATLAFARGVHYAVVQAMLTHKDVSTTISIYSHLDVEMIRRGLAEPGEHRVQTMDNERVDIHNAEALRGKLFRRDS